MYVKYLEVFCCGVNCKIGVNHLMAKFSWYNPQKKTTKKTRLPLWLSNVPPTISMLQFMNLSHVKAMLE